MKGICPNCEKVTVLEWVSQTEDIQVRELAIPTHVEYFRCKTCGAEFDDPCSDYDALEVAYREYRKRRLER